MNDIPLAALLPVLVVAIAFVAYCLYDLVRQADTRYLPKPVWAIFMVISIPLGGILYLLLGRTFPAGHAGGRA